MSAAGNPPRQRALIYNRASADKAGQRVSVESQDKENRDFCTREGWDVVATVTDNNRSASRYAARDREGYRDIRAGLSDGRWGRIDVLVAWESSRAQRNLADFVAFRELCEQHEVLFAYRGRVYDLTSGDDRFSTGLDALLDEREAERAQERTLRSHRHSVREGRPRSFAPYGYTRTYGTGGRLVDQLPDPVTSLVVQRIAQRVIAGDTLYVIAQALNNDRVLPPRAHRAEQMDRPVEHNGWTPTILRNLLSKPSLMGMRTHRGTIVGEATWAAIVDPGEWAQVQAMLNSPQRLTARTRSATHLLSGIAECGICHGWLRPLLNRGRMTYACAGVNPTAPKGHVARSAELLDSYVLVQVITWLASPHVREWLAPKPQVPELAAAAQRKLDGLLAQLADFESQAVALTVSAQAFSRIEAGLLPQIAALKQQTELPVLPPVVAKVAGPGAKGRFLALSMVEKRQVLRAVARVEVHRTSRRGVREFDSDTVDVTIGQARWAAEARTSGVQGSTATPSPVD